MLLPFTHTYLTDLLQITHLLAVNSVYVCVCVCLNRLTTRGTPNKSINFLGSNFGSDPGHSVVKN